ncbi:SDR family NAD(P)-dependent oxidoreductase [Massilia horti]|nr:SDR family oxidoreductase [Massilia horti]
MQDRVVIVSGGTSGVGKAIATRFVEEGAHVVILGLNDVKGNEVQEQLRATAKKHGVADCIYLHTDVSDSTEVQNTLRVVTERWHQVHVLVNNAAIMKSGALVDMDVADWDETMAINLRGPFLLSKYSIPVMPPEAAIVNISSVHAIATDANTAAYTASKGGLEALTRALAIECYPRKIRVNALRLGAVDTGMLWNNPDVQSGEEKVDLNEVASPELIAELALFLASQRSRFVSGAVLTADAGRLPILASHAS